MLLGQPGEAATHLGLDDLLGLAGLAVFEFLTDTDDGLERRGEGGEGFLGDERVAFELILAALGVAKDDVADEELLEHPGASLARVRAEVVLAHGLRAEAERGAFDGFGDGFQRGEGRADDDVHFLHAGQLALQAGNEVQALGHGFVHLPVAGDDEFAFFVHGRSWELGV